MTFRVSFGLQPLPPLAERTEIFSGATSHLRAPTNQRMAATVAEGTAPKPVQANAGASPGRPNSGNEVRGVFYSRGLAGGWFARLFFCQHNRRAHRLGRWLAISPQLRRMA